MGTLVIHRSESSDLMAARVVQRINGIVESSSLELAVKIGRIVVEELYGGDIERWRARGPKEHTLRQVAADPRLSISASALFRALGIYELKLRMPEHPMWSELTATHARAVLGLPGPEQRRLLALATEQKWTTQAIERAAATSRAEHKSSRGGRPRKPRFARSLERAERALADTDAVFGDLDALDAQRPPRPACR